jgi:hypothetical protein
MSLEQHLQTLYPEGELSDAEAADAARRLVMFFEILERVDNRLKAESDAKNISATHLSLIS